MACEDQRAVLAPLAAGVGAVPPNAPVRKGALAAGLAGAGLAAGAAVVGVSRWPQAVRPPAQGSTKTVKEKDLIMAAIDRAVDRVTG